MVGSTAITEELVCIGAGTTIGEGTFVTRSVLGRGCRVGTGAHISHSFLLPRVTVQNGVKITNAFIGTGVKLCEGCVVSDGCVISQGCVISPGHVVAAHTRVTLCNPGLRASDESSEETEAPTRALDDGSDTDEPCGPSDAVLAVCSRRSQLGTSNVPRFLRHSSGCSS